MSNNNITDLRSVLFEALQGIKAGTMDIDKARAINEISKTIVDTAKVEVEFIKATGGAKSSFLAPAQDMPALPAGISGVTRHRLQG